MGNLELKLVKDLTLQVERILDRVRPQLAALLPDAELHHIGATAIPGALTKGDIDVLVRVAPEGFSRTVDVLKRHFMVKQLENWTAEFASFGDEARHELPLGIQVVVKDSSADFFVFLRDYLISNRDALDEYNRLKLRHVNEGPESYWKAKDEFLGAILASRSRQEAT